MLFLTEGFTISGLSAILDFRMSVHTRAAYNDNKTLYDNKTYICSWWMTIRGNSSEFLQGGPN